MTYFLTVPRIQYNCKFLQYKYKLYNAIQKYIIQMENIEYEWKVCNMNRKHTIQRKKSYNTNGKLYNTNWKDQTL